MIDPPILLNDEVRGAVWQKLRAFLLARIDTHRAALERERPEVETNVLRGRIAELRRVINSIEGEQ